MAQTAVVPSQIVNVTTAKILGRSTAGTGVCEQIDCTAAGRALLDDADASAQRTTLGLGTMSVETAANYPTSAAAALLYGEPTAAMVGSYHNLQNTPTPSRWSNLRWVPYQNTTPLSIGTSQPTITGTGSHNDAVTTSYRQSLYRFTVTGSAVAGNIAQISTNSKGCLIGDSAAIGGFFYCCIFGVGATVAASQHFVGLSNGNPATTTTEPSAVAQMIILGADAADTNMQVMCRASGAATKVDLGASFPAHTAGTVYRFWLYCDRNASSIQYQVDRLDSSATTSGTLSTNLPTNTTTFGARARESNNATGTSCILDLYSMDIWVKY